MGQCVTKCKNPSSTLGSKNGERETGSKSHSKRSAHKDDHASACGKSSGDILVNGTKKADAAVESGLPSAFSGDTKKDSVSSTEESSLQRIGELFRRYKDEREDAILEEGIER